MVFSNNLLFGAAAEATSGAAAFDTTLIGNSIWLDGSADLLTKSSFAGHASKKVISVWVQRTGFSSFGLIRGTNSTSDRVGFGDNVLNNQVYVVVNGQNLYSNRSFRDIGWYHYLVSFDLTQSVAINKVKVYINGVDLDGSGGWQTDERSAMSSSFGSFNSASVAQQIGRDGASSMYLNAYLAQYCELDGQSIQSGDVATTDFYDTFTFGTNGSQIIPKKDSVIAALATAAGSNSFCLDFSDSSGTDAANLGNDISSNNNDFTPISMAAANQSVHTPSKVYAAWNPLRNFATDAVTLSEGNLTIASNTGPVLSTKAIPSTGKWVVTAEVSQRNFTLGVATESVGTSKLGTDSKGFCMVETTVDLRARTGNVDTNITSALNAGDKVIAAFDADTGKLWLGADTGSGYTYLGGGNPVTGATPTFTISSTETLYFAAGSQGGTFACDFGQNDFDGTVPSGFQSLNSSNLTAPDYQGKDYFDATLYEGNGAGQRVGDFVPFTDTYTVDKSAMFEEADKRYLSFTPSSGGDQKTFTFSTWFKLTNGALGQRNTFLSVDDGSKQAQINHMGDQSNKNIKVNFYNGSSHVASLTTDQEIRRQDQWYHLVVAVDTRAAVSSANKIKIYINGVQQATSGTALSTNDYETEVNSENEHNIGRQTNNAVGEPSWYLAETVMVEGSQLDPTSFGQVDTSTNRWVPKDVSGLTFGDEGWYLEYEGTFNSGVAATGAGKDSSGNNNHWAEQNDSGSAWATTDQFTDTPSQNFDNLGGGQVGGTISDGNTKAALGTGGNQIRSNFNLNAGKWYVESDIQATNNSASIGLVPSRSATFSNGPGRDANGGISYETDGDVFSDNVQNATAEASFAAGDVVQMAIDMDAKKVYFGKNNTFGGNPAAGTGGHSLPASILSDGAALITLGNYSGSQSSTQQINYGQFLNFDGGSTTNGFKYTPPTGFKAVNQDNLDDTASKITAWSWIKNRDASDNHMLIDRVRGVGKDVHSNLSNAEVTNANTVQRFLQRGVQIGDDVEVNTASESFVLWQWLAGDSATTGTVFSADNPPSLASTVIAANADHFSVGTYTGDGGTSATIKHGLSAAPEMIWVKNRSQGDEWLVGTEYNGYTSPWNYYAHLETAGNFAANSNAWNNTEPSTSAPFVFTVGTSDRCNASGENYVFYCFRSVPGVCKVGSYIGNGDGTGSDTVDGPYISTGFKPKWLLVKWAQGGSLSGEGWLIKDTSRQVINPNDDADIYANGTSENAGATHGADILADGFKLRGGGGANNKLNATYLYLAMADIGGNGTLPPIYGR